MSSAVELIEQARAESIVLLYRQESDGKALWAWSPSWVPRSTQARYRRQFRDQYEDVCTLLKLAVLE